MILYMVIICTSLSVWMAYLTIQVVKSRNWVKSSINIFFFACIVFVLFGIYNLIQRNTSFVLKGNVVDTSPYMIIILYICMALGMFGNYMYTHFDTPRNRRKRFDFATMMAPVFASPIIFVPLLASLQAAQVDLSNATYARIMLFLVAFENGFFWRDYFAHRKIIMEKK